MSITKKRALLALMLAVPLMVGVWWHLTRRVLPGMMQEGNHTLLARAARALEEYYTDHQRWPAGPPDEVFYWLAGGTETDFADWRASRDNPQLPIAPAEDTTRRLPTIKGKNYARNHGVKSESWELVDAWSNSLQFDLPADGSRPATVTSIGPDGRLGTADDVSVTLAIGPQHITPTIAMFEAVENRRREQEFRAAEQAIRKARREAAREAAAAARRAP
jgi:type II secretory pathway pseudopilin PulG